MTLAHDTRTEVERAIGRRIAAARPVAGGCISPAWVVEDERGDRLFVKTAPAGAPAFMLEQEARSLGRLAATATVRVPAVRGVSERWLALEWLEPQPSSDDAWAALGASLARLHRTRSEQYGWDATNCIGPLVQTNEPSGDWPSFWRERRLRPQLDLAAGRLDADIRARFDTLLHGLDDRLGPANEDGPSLLHGDLWSGNVHFTDGGAALIDPASSNGHREVDLAMAALFGGFPAPFFDAYSAEWPLLTGAAPRRPIYQLYYLLVHVNLFGGGYIEQTRRTLDAALR